MTEQHQTSPDLTKKQVITIVLGTSFALPLLIYVVVKLVLGISAVQPVVADQQALASRVEQRIKPVAMVELVDAGSESQAVRSGEDVYAASCAACHSSGALDSPKLGDKAVWAPRIAQGYDTLVQNAINGIRMMPAKGGNPALSDAEVAAAVAHMANQSGADFTPASE